MTDRVVVVGSGFLGAAIGAATRSSGLPTWTTSRRPGRSAVRVADVESFESLETALRSATMVVHAASYLGPDARLAHAVNVEGTQNVVKASEAVGARRLLYVSTAAVYGMGPHRGVRAEEGAINPASIGSASRVEAELIVRAAAGAVVRPNLVLGEGDRWVASAIRALLEKCGGIPESTRTTHVSVISTDTLGHACARLLLRDEFWRAEYPRCFNAVEPRAARTVDVIDQVLGDQLVQTFQPQLTPLQQQVLDLLHIPASVYT